MAKKKTKSAAGRRSPKNSKRAVGRAAKETIKRVNTKRSRKTAGAGPTRRGSRSQPTPKPDLSIVVEVTRRDGQLELRRAGSTEAPPWRVKADTLIAIELKKLNGYDDLTVLVEGHPDLPSPFDPESKHTNSADPSHGRLLFPSSKGFPITARVRSAGKVTGQALLRRLTGDTQRRFELRFEATKKGGPPLILVGQTLLLDEKL